MNTPSPVLVFDASLHRLIYLGHFVPRLGIDPAQAINNPVIADGVFYVCEVFVGILIGSTDRHAFPFRVLYSSQPRIHRHQASRRVSA